MYRIGIDVGSSFTKYCVMSEEQIIMLECEETPIRQAEYFEKKVEELTDRFPNAVIIACGYGRDNVEGLRTVNELSALARGIEYMLPGSEILIDIGGQDAKIIRQENGRLKEFFLNDKCAAGSGIFLNSICSLLKVPLKEINLDAVDSEVKISSVCAVFAQTEVVRLISQNVPESVIIKAIIIHILEKAGALLKNVKTDRIVFTGGLAEIDGIDQLARQIWNMQCETVQNGQFLAAIGCALEGDIR